MVTGDDLQPPGPRAEETHPHAPGAVLAPPRTGEAARHRADLVATVHDAVAGVPDPELPPVTLGMLGMIHAIRVIDGHRAEIELLPTFSGCPATDMMGRDVEAAVRSVGGIDEVAITWRYDPPWRSSRITDEGREALASFGIAPPVGVDEPVGARPGDRPTLPVMTVDAPAARAPVACPYCGSTATAQESPFGPTPCRDIRFCEGCQQPFEAFKQL